ncbi:MAG: lysophospholipid acyltransferase family protein [Candidatus Kerfeldbacteria bacterium]
MKSNGANNIPKTGTYILASNHQFSLDPFFLGAWIWRPVHFFAKKELWNNKIQGWLISRMHAFPVNRNAVDRKVFRLIFKVFDSGQGLVFFPEGTRGSGDTLLPGKPGLGLIIKLYCTKPNGTPMPIVPVYLQNSHQLSACFWRKEKLALRIGNPIPADVVARYLTTGKDGYQKLADLIMQEILKLKQLDG